MKLVAGRWFDYLQNVLIRKYGTNFVLQGTKT